MTPEPPELSEPSPSTPLSTAPPPPSSPLLPIILLSAAGFTVLTTEFVIVGLLPAMARDLRVTVPQAGLLVTAFAMTVAVAGPGLTAWLVRFERKRLFLLTLLLFGLSNAVAACATHIAVMTVARLVPALMLPVFWSLASETAVRITGPERAGKAISMVSFGVVAATIFGIPIGTLIADRFGWRTAFATLAVLALAKMVLLLRFLPRLPGSGERVPVLRQLGILRDPRVLSHAGLSVAVFAGMFTAYTYLADMLEKLARFSGSAVGWILMGFGGVGLIGNWTGGRMVDRSPLGATILFCLPLAAGLFLLAPSLGLALAGSAPLTLTGVLFIWGLCQSALFTVSHTRVMKSAAGSPALAASLNISGANLGIALGAWIGGLAIEWSGLRTVGATAAVIVLAATAAAAWLAGAEARWGVKSAETS